MAEKPVRVRLSVADGIRLEVGRIITKLIIWSALLGSGVYAASLIHEREISLGGGGFSCIPEVPQRGRAMNIRLNSGKACRIEVTFTPPGTTEEHDLPVGGSCTVTVPSDAITVLVHDKSGASVDLARAVK